MSHTNDCKLNWLHTAGYVSDINTAWSNYLADLGFTGQINDQEYAWLGSQGYTGTLNDRWFAYLRDRGGVGALPDMLNQFWCGGAGIDPPGPAPSDPAVWVLATFDNYTTPATILLPNEVVSDDPGDAGHVGTIEQGYMQCWNTSIRAMLENQYLSQEGNGNNTVQVYRSGKEKITPTPGIYQKFSAQLVGSFTHQLLFTGQAETSRDHGQFGMTAGGSGEVYRFWAGITQKNMARRSQGYVGNLSQNYRLVYGGYNAAGEPDPQGDRGMVCYVNDIVAFSEPQAVYNNDPTESVEVGAITAFGNRLLEYEMGIDSAKLATPQRALFDVVGPVNLADYTPEDGVAFTDGGTVSGIVVENGGCKGSNGMRATFVSLGGVQWEIKAAAGDPCHITLRLVDESNRFNIDLWDTFLQINEITGGSTFQRASTTVVNGDGQRLMANDDKILDAGGGVTPGELFGVYTAEGKTASHKSTVHLTADRVGFGFSVTNQVVEWFCCRGGTVEAG